MNYALLCNINLIRKEHITKEVDQLYRDLSGQLITSLVSYFNLDQWELAEDLVQNTFLEALDQWQIGGIPKEPKSWLFKVCKNKTINHLKKTHKQINSAYSEIEEPWHQLDHAFSEEEIHSNQLRLLFALSHPEFPVRTQIILILKSLAGFKNPEIALALNLNEENVKKIITRVRNTIREKNMVLKVPYRLQSKDRLNVVLHALYLIFNEGYYSSSGNEIIRKDLCLQALRLTHEILQDQIIANPDSQALFSLMLFNIARFDARISAEGNFILLQDQDRKCWDQEIIHKATHWFNKARKATPWSRYHFEAAIASIHCHSPGFNETKWDKILWLYDQLLLNNDSTYIRFNRNIALFFSGKPEKALNELFSMSEMESVACYHTVLGDIRKHFNQFDQAIDHYLEALGKSVRDYEKVTIQKKIESIQHHIH